MPRSSRSAACRDPTCYPDPQSAALRVALAEMHNVAPHRTLLAASASEFIERITAVGRRLRAGPVSVPRHAYGDFGWAAAAWKRPIQHGNDEGATLRWAPSLPAR